jgi:hypothetical protein
VEMFCVLLEVGSLVKVENKIHIDQATEQSGTSLERKQYVLVCGRYYRQAKDDPGACVSLS